MEIVNLSDIKDPSVVALLETAARARTRAYIPFSKFAVGAALLTTGGEVVTGCNVENVSFGLTICAERTAVVKAVSEGHTSFKEVAVAAVSATDFLVTPCGACRQFLSEFAPDLKIYLYDPTSGRVGVTRLGHLLPHAVLPTNLNKALNNGSV